MPLTRSEVGKRTLLLRLTVNTQRALPRSGPTRYSSFLRSFAHGPEMGTIGLLGVRAHRPRASRRRCGRLSVVPAGLRPVGSAAGFLSAAGCRCSGAICLPVPLGKFTFFFFEWSAVRPSVCASVPVRCGAMSAKCFKKA